LEFKNKADATLTLSSAALYKFGSHLPFTILGLG